MLKSAPSMGRTMDKSQEIFKPGSTFTLERETRNGQIKTPVEEVNGNGIKESNGTTIHNRSAEKSDSPLSHSTPNDSSEMSSLSESPSLMQDDLKPKVVAGITSEDETSVILDTTENNRKSKKRRWDDRGQIDEEDEGNPAVRSKLEEPAECNNQTEVLKTIEVDFVQLREQLYREQVREHDKELEDVRKGVHSEQKLRMEEIEKKRSRRLDVIASRKRYQEHHCQKQFEEEKCRLRYQFLADSRELRNRMLESFETRKYELIREKNRSGRLEYSEPDRNYLRLQQEQRIIEFAYLQENHGFPAAPPLESLRQEEIEEDLLLMGITRDDDQTLALSSSPSSPRPITLDSNNNPFFSLEDPDVYCSGDQLVYYGQIFKKGDLVLVSDSTSGRYTAKFLIAFDTEAVIQRPDGSKTRLQLNLLKEGKYQIQLKET